VGTKINFAGYLRGLDVARDGRVRKMDVGAMGERQMDRVIIEHIQRVQ